MIEFTLMEQIYAFVKSVRMVKEEQVLRFFRDFPELEVAFAIRRLKAERYIHSHEEGRLSTAMRLYAPLAEYDSTIDAIDALCEFTSHEILWIRAQSFPLELAFGTVSGAAYCISTFTNNWQVKYSLTPAARSQHIIDGEENPMKYIAVVRDTDVMSKIVSLGFDLYVAINPDGSVDIYEPPED